MNQDYTTALQSGQQSEILYQKKQNKTYFVLRSRPWPPGDWIGILSLLLVLSLTLVNC